MDPESTEEVKENISFKGVSGQHLSGFLDKLEDYTPAIPDAVTQHHLTNAGFDSHDSRIVRLVSLAAQKFISNIANDALQHYRARNAHLGSKQKAKETKHVLTMEDLGPVLKEYGKSVEKPKYYV